MKLKATKRNRKERKKTETYLDAKINIFVEIA